MSKKTTFKEKNFAPEGLPSLSRIIDTDYSTFKKSEDEKKKTEKIRKQHKRDLVRYYGKGNIGRKLNIKTE